MAQIYQRTEQRHWLDPSAFVIDYKGILDSAMQGAAVVLSGANAMGKLGGKPSSPAGATPTSTEDLSKEWDNSLSPTTAGWDFSNSIKPTPDQEAIQPDGIPSLFSRKTFM